MGIKYRVVLNANAMRLMEQFGNFGEQVDNILWELHRFTSRSAPPAMAIGRSLSTLIFIWRAIQSLFLFVFTRLAALFVLSLSSGFKDPLAEQEEVR